MYTFSICSEEKSIFPKTFDEDMEMLANKLFECKPTLVAKCLKWLKEILQHREMVGAWSLNFKVTENPFLWITEKFLFVFLHFPVDSVWSEW